MEIYSHKDGYETFYYFELKQSELGNDNWNCFHFEDFLLDKGIINIGEKSCDENVWYGHFETEERAKEVLNKIKEYNAGYNLVKTLRMNKTKLSELEQIQGFLKVLDTDITLRVKDKTNNRNGRKEKIYIFERNGLNTGCALTFREATIFLTGFKEAKYGNRNSKFYTGRDNQND